jgi:hypothetical protein
VPHFQTRLGERTDRRGKWVRCVFARVPRACSPLLPGLLLTRWYPPHRGRAILPVVGVGIVLNHTSR